MLELDWKTKTALSSELPSSNNKSPRLPSKLQISIPAPKPRPAELTSASDEACSAYEAYLRLPELRELWSETKFPGWKSERILRPALTGLEITFRFVSTALSDPRPYSNQPEWTRRLEALVGSEVEIISMLLCDDDDGPNELPLVDLTSSPGVLSRKNSSAEVWKSSDGDKVVVCHVSPESLLPRLATRAGSNDVWRRIHHHIESQMTRCRSFTLGLGEPNLAGKPSLDYDALCKPSAVHALKKGFDENYESQTVHTTHQILESWICVAKELLQKIRHEANLGLHRKASDNCWLVERIWELLSQIESLHLLMDPDDLLRLKAELAVRPTSHESERFGLRSRGLVEITRSCKELKRMVPDILGVEVDPTGGPVMQDSAMELYRRKEDFARIHLLQAMQGVEASVKRFYFGYRQVLCAIMGSLEVKGNAEMGDALNDVVAEGTYYPSLDGAKTFLGEWWSSRP